jgi:hypothetical protein
MKLVLRLNYSYVEKNNRNVYTIFNEIHFVSCKSRNILKLGSAHISSVSDSDHIVENSDGERVCVFIFFALTMKYQYY